MTPYFFLPLPLFILYNTFDNARQLISTLLANYDSRVRPINNQWTAIGIDVSLFLFSINEVDEVKEKLTSTGCLEVSWTEPNSKVGPRQQRYLLLRFNS
jgi:hypothetical protein